MRTRPRKGEAFRSIWRASRQEFICCDSCGIQYALGNRLTGDGDPEKLVEIRVVEIAPLPGAEISPVVGGGIALCFACCDKPKKIQGAIRRKLRNDGPEEGK